MNGRRDTFAIFAQEFDTRRSTRCAGGTQLSRALEDECPLQIMSSPTHANSLLCSPSAQSRTSDKSLAPAELAASSPDVLLADLFDHLSALKVAYNAWWTHVEEDRCPSPHAPASPKANSKTCGELHAHRCRSPQSARKSAHGMNAHAMKTPPNVTKRRQSKRSIAGRVDSSYTRAVLFAESQDGECAATIAPPEGELPKCHGERTDGHATAKLKLSQDHANLMDLKENRLGCAPTSTETQRRAPEHGATKSAPGRASTPRSRRNPFSHILTKAARHSEMGLTEAHLETIYNTAEL